MTVKQIIKLSTEDAQGLQAKTLAGDLASGNAFILYSIWKKLNQTKELTLKSKIKLLSYFAKNLEIQWQIK